MADAEKPEDFPVPAYCPNCGTQLPLAGLLRPMIYAIMSNMMEWLQAPEGAEEPPAEPTTQTHQDAPKFGEKSSW